MKLTHGGTDIARLLTPVASNLPLPLQDEGVRYASQGSVLVIGPAALIVPAAQKLAQATRVVACGMDNLPASSARANPLFIPCQIRVVHGFLGNFRVGAQDPAGNPLELDLFSPKPDGGFDLVLDLSVTPLLSVPIKPPGYFSPQPANIDVAIEQLLTLKGSFRKPRFFHYDAGLCAHGAQNVEGCTRCLSRCPAEAITSIGGRIEVNAHLCQGCSTCMLVCPTGALSHGIQTPETMLAALATKVHAEVDRLCIREANAPMLTEQGTAYLTVPAIAAAGPEIWFSALALGFRQVLIQIPDDLPELTRDALNQQIIQAHALLAAVGHPVARIVSSSSAPPTLPAPEIQPTSIPILPAYVGKRDLLLWALDTLQGSSKRSRFVELPPGADMGGIQVDSVSCTLCMACTQLCPTNALISESGQTRLDFIESRCIQCGICGRACPETAISVQPRFLLDAVERRTPVTLIQDQKHHCPQCGEPFISKELLAKSIQIMQFQGNLGDDGIENLRSCPRCRVQQLHKPVAAN